MRLIYNSLYMSISLKILESTRMHKNTRYLILQTTRHEKINERNKIKQGEEEARGKSHGRQRRSA